MCIYIDLSKFSLTINISPRCAAPPPLLQSTSSDDAADGAAAADATARSSHPPPASSATRGASSPILHSQTAPCTYRRRPTPSARTGRSAASFAFSPCRPPRRCSRQRRCAATVAQTRNDFLSRHKPATPQRLRPGHVARVEAGVLRWLGSRLLYFESGFVNAIRENELIIVRGYVRQGPH